MATSQDPFDLSYQYQSTQNQLGFLTDDRLRAGALDISTQMRNIQLTQLRENQLRMQQMQQQMLSNLQRANVAQMVGQSALGQTLYNSGVALPGANPGTTGIAGRNVGYTESGAYTQNTGGLFADAGFARAVNIMTAGVFHQGYARSFGASRAQVTQTASEELKQRGADFFRSIGQEIIPEWMRVRMRGSYFGVKVGAYADQTGDLARSLEGQFAGVTARDLTGTGINRNNIKADGSGLRLGGSFLQSITANMQNAAESFNAARGYSVTGEEMTDLQNFTRLGSLSDQRRFRSTVTTPGKAERSLAEATDLAQALKLNTKQLLELGTHINSLGFTMKETKSIMRSAAIPGMGMDDEMNAAQRADLLANLAVQGKSRYYGNGQRFAESQYNSAMAIREQFIGQRRFDELSRFGGATQAEQATRYQAYMNELGTNATQRYGSSLGVAITSGTNWTKGMQGMTSDVAAAYSQNPFAGVDFSVDAEAQRRSSELMPLAVYIRARDAARMMKQGDKTTALLLGRGLNISGPAAMEMVKTFEGDRKNLEGLSKSSGIAVEDILRTKTLTNLKIEDLQKTDPAKLSAFTKIANPTQDDIEELTPMSTYRSGRKLLTEKEMYGKSAFDKSGEELKKMEDKGIISIDNWFGLKYASKWISHKYDSDNRELPELEGLLDSSKTEGGKRVNQLATDEGMSDLRKNSIFGSMLDSQSSLKDYESLSADTKAEYRKKQNRDFFDWKYGDQGLTQEEWKFRLGKVTAEFEDEDDHGAAAKKELASKLMRLSNQYGNDRLSSQESKNLVEGRSVSNIDAKISGPEVSEIKQMISRFKEDSLKNTPDIQKVSIVFDAASVQGFKDVLSSLSSL